MTEQSVGARRRVRDRTAGWRLKLLQAFELRHDGQTVELPIGVQRLLAFLAVLGRPARRTFVAGTLWPDSSEQHANGSLRSALWRLRHWAPDVVAVDGPDLMLSPAVQVDFDELIDRSHRLVRDGIADAELASDPTQLTQALLPDWYEEWLAADRERLRQLQLHALEILSSHMRERDEYAEAIEMANLAVAAEPTRESARRALIEAHLAEGNVDEAIRQFRSFKRLLTQELGVRPSARLEALVSVPPGDTAVTRR